MSGPPPKPSAQRRRRNAAPAVVRLPASGSKQEPPELGSVCEETQSWWGTIWASPMAVVWLAADVPTLVRLARLVDRVNLGESSAALLAEIRQLEDRFGLSPLARRRLQWELEQASGEAAEPDRADDGRWLRAL